MIPVHGGISLDLSRLDRILDIAPENLTATVQAGVTRLTLERAVGQHGLFFPVDPGADATLGGMAATNAAGTTTVRYGKMRANVLALEAVLADGRVIRTGTQRGEDVGRLRPHGPARRLGGNARRDHRGDGAAPRDPGARRCAAHRLPRRRERLPDGRRRRRRRLRRHARRVARRVGRRGRQRVLGDVVPRGAVPVRRGVGKRGARARRPRARAGDRNRGGRDRHRPRARPRRAGPPLEGASRRRARDRGDVPGHEGAGDRRLRAARRSWPVRSASPAPRSSGWG